MLLDGKIALITGATGGMGRAVAEYFVAEGARVVLADLPRSDGDSLAKTIGGENAIFVGLDVTSESSWSEAIEVTRERFGGLDVLVNNAGIVGGFGPIDEIDRDTFVRTFEVNTLGAFLGMRAALPLLKTSESASVVNVSSSVAMMGQGFVTPYVASKWAVRGLSKAAALELGAEGIRVNSVHPGVTRTPMTEGGDIERETAEQPIARPAEPIEIAHIIGYVASDLSSYSTGGEFIADGGHSAGKLGRSQQ